MSTPLDASLETPTRRYPKRLKAGSPLPPPQPPPVKSEKRKRRVSKPLEPTLESEPVLKLEPELEALKLEPKLEPILEPKLEPKPEFVPSSPQPPAVQSNGAELCSLPSADSCERTDPLAAGCLVSELPQSSSTLKDVPAASLADLFSVYSYLRSFSRLLFLSPFSLEKFVTALCAGRGDGLLDSVHLSLLEAVKRHNLSTESSSFFGDLNWDLLDLITWPVYLCSFLRTQGYSKLRKHSLVKAGLGRGEYQKQVPVAEKLAILSFLCDHAIQNEESRKEVSVRLMAAHQALIEHSNQRSGEGDSDWRPQDARHDSRGQETPLLRKVSDKLLKDTERGEWSKEVQRAATALGGDGNSNDCMLCGMDGVLLCCDACPAAYHSRCVGVTKGKLGSGDWFCPECRFPCTGIPYAKRLQGGVLLGIGPKERLFLSTCDHLLVTEVGEKETRYWYYGIAELSSVLKFLQTSGHGYFELQHSIRRHWGIDCIANPEIGSVEDLKGSNEKFFCSPLRAPLPRSSAKKRKSENNVGNDDLVLLDSASNQTPKSEGKSRTSKTLVNPGPYVNHYAHGDAVATAADTLAAWQGGGDPAWVPGTRARGTDANEQVKAFTLTLSAFTWPSTRKPFSEKCGWCGLCSSNSRGCLLVQTQLQVSRYVDDLKPLKISKGPRHLGTVAAYVLHLEETLHPLLEGWPWDSPLQRQRWRSRVEKSPSVSVIRKALLQLEAALRPIAISTDWVKHPDIAPLLWPACMVKRQSLPWSHHSEVPPTRQCGAQWWRGGKVARLICGWEALPRENLKQAARKGGVIAISGLLYNDTNAIPQRTKQTAWRSRVETASSIAEIGLQVRYFDLQLKWKELMADPGDIDTPFIHEKCKEDCVTKYLVDMTNEEIEAEKLNKDNQTSKMQIDSEGEKQIWKPEQQVPLCQIKLYEKFFGEKFRKPTPGKKKKVANKEKALGPLERRTLNAVLDKLLEKIKLEDRKLELEAKKLQTSKSPSRRAAEKRTEASAVRPQCQRCAEQWKATSKAVCQGPSYVIQRRECEGRNQPNQG
ncbi:DDT domain-containing protein PTM isoform X2 [Physcomitrium patens]|uniref:PHD-type domain-containing protein n=1 Tax=Physcomitrium patens TaxID=3218 RepID=A0A2K1KAI2_PHYPA|nr:DDT domain-containing protein PTM-like isoform X2 [Physcomitrium patens]PNR50787.1 hypothetical protein PHYPA_009973 [Physcomitrium patens]|eukprot:XP_024379600.1 DDT domain-containing protein PTM-like isoform X2 [Physcomitrella patens]